MDDITIIEVSVGPASPEQAKCDFCSGPHAFWSYPTKPFVVFDLIKEKGVGASSDGGWAACDTCHDLIEADNYPALAYRTMQTSYHKLPEALQSLYLEFITELHQKFRKARTGPGYKMNMG